MSNKIDLKAELVFVSFCIEEYKTFHQMDGAATALLFEKYGVTDYLMKNYDVLHTLGRNAILKDIDYFIAERNIQK